LATIFPPKVANLVEFTQEKHINSAKNLQNVWVKKNKKKKNCPPKKSLDMRYIKNLI
jgi:hypothetical protein